MSAPPDDELLAAYDEPIVKEIAMVLWGSHERAAAASHRPEHVERLFCDANASYVLAATIYVKVLAPLRVRVAQLETQLASMEGARDIWIDAHDHQASLVRQRDDRIKAQGPGAAIGAAVRAQPLLREFSDPIVVAGLTVDEAVEWSKAQMTLAAAEDARRDALRKRYTVTLTIERDVTLDENGTSDKAIVHVTQYLTSIGCRVPGDQGFLVVPRDIRGATA